MGNERVSYGAEGQWKSYGNPKLKGNWHGDGKVGGTEAMGKRGDGGKAGNGNEKEVC